MASSTMAKRKRKAKATHGGRREGAGRPSLAEGTSPRITLRLPAELLEQLDRAAELLETKRAELLRELLERGLAWPLPLEQLERAGELAGRLGADPADLLREAFARGLEQLEAGSAGLEA